MKRSERLKVIAKNIFGDLDETISQVEAHAELLKGRSEWPAEEIPELSTLQPGEGTGVLEPPVDEVARMLALGAKAAARVGSDEKLSPGEGDALEAIIVLYGRPALLVQDNNFPEPPIKWQSLKNNRPRIQNVLRSVGRVEVENHPDYLSPYVGTGFLAGSGILMTNRHVAKVFVKGSGRSWRFLPGVRARVDYKEEYRRDIQAEFELEECLAVHRDYDLALFKVAQRNSRGQGLPEPLMVSREAPEAIRDLPVYVVGYPAWDDRNNLREMQRIFKGVFDVKRLQPGFNTGLTEDRFPKMKHDCSTLGGNSGSPVVDLETNKVIGLHFSGTYRTRNLSVPLWKLADDQVLKQFQINWG
jgi:hypothetical protein